MHRSAIITQLKNESSILEHWLDTVGDLTDYIVVLNDNSDDNSVEILENSEYSKKIDIIKNDSRLREEGRGYQICLQKAKELGAKRIYVSDPDEIPSPYSVGIMDNLINSSTDSYMIHRAELALDQSTVYGTNEGNGKLVITNINGANFNNNVIHSSQPMVAGKTCVVPSTVACLLHYGPSCYASQVFKCLCYIIWENKSLDKSYECGYNEYFKLYRNFVKIGDEGAKQYMGDFKLPYQHWLPKEIAEFCINEVDVFDDDLDIVKTIQYFKDVKGVKEMVFGRVK